jgi:hypothetical protein
MNYGMLLNSDLSATSDSNRFFASSEYSNSGQRPKLVITYMPSSSHSITASAGTGGSISPSGSVSVNYGASQTFTITPNTNYGIANVLVDGTLVGAVSTYTFSNVTANHTISASFAANTYTYTLTVAKAGTGTGTISGTGINCGTDCTEAYNSGTSVTLTATPDASSTFAGWSGGCTGTGTCTVTMDAAKTVTATFTIGTYTITATAGTGGSISPSGSVTVNHGASQTFTITPNANYSVANVVADGSSVGAVTTYTFTNVTGSHAISVSFTTLDSDNDGIPDIEEQGPESNSTNYDGNNDGIPDYLQSSVASFHTFDRTNYITLSSPDGYSLSNVAATQVPQDAPFEATFPYNFIEFIVENLPQGASTNIVIEFPEGTSVNSYYKYGPTLEDTTPHWYDFQFDGQTGAEISANIITLHLIDGLRGDDDLTVNGQILDQGGPAIITDITGLPKTGQTISYAVGDDGYIQAGIEWPGTRFTYNNDGTVTDNLTGLMWLRDGGCIKKSWSYAFSAITDFNNKRGNYRCQKYTANYSDWRLPNVKELESLINYGASNSSTWLNSLGFFVNMKSSYYWSSTTDKGYTSKAWSVMMSDGRETSNRKSNAYYIVPVRTGTSGNPYELPGTGQTTSYAQGDDGYVQAGNDWPNPRFTNNGDGTVTDNLTGLIWLKDGGCIKNSWSNALNAIADFNNKPGNYNCLEYAANYSDWRLPNVKELESLINYGAANPAVWLNSEGFVDVGSYYWSSTTYQGSTTQAWVMDMTKANMIPTKKSYTNYVWPVRAENVVNP